MSDCFTGLCSLSPGFFKDITRRVRRDWEARWCQAKDGQLAVFVSIDQSSKNFKLTAEFSEEQIQ